MCESRWEHVVYLRAKYSMHNSVPVINELLLARLHGETLAGGAFDGMLEPRQPYPM